MQMFNAICFFKDKNKQPLKYRKITSEIKFNKFISSKNVWYYNMYCNKTRQFIKRIYL